MLTSPRRNGPHQLPVHRPGISGSLLARAIGLIALFSIALTSVGAPVAHAGSYRVWSCTDANGASVPTTDGTAGWSNATSPGGSPVLGGAAKENRCSSADPNPAGRYLLAVLTAQAGMSGEWADGWSFTVPGSTVLRQIELWWQGSISDTAGFYIHIESPNTDGSFAILDNRGFPWGSNEPYADTNYWSLPGAAYPNTLPTPPPSVIPRLGRVPTRLRNHGRASAPGSRSTARASRSETTRRQPATSVAHWLSGPCSVVSYRPR